MENYKEINADFVGQIIIVDREILHKNGDDANCEKVV